MGRGASPRVTTRLLGPKVHRGHTILPKDGARVEPESQKSDRRPARPERPDGDSSGSLRSCRAATHSLRDILVELILVSLPIGAGCQGLMPAEALDQPKPALEARSIEPVSPPWFQDVTAQMGLNFVHEAGPTGKYFIPQLFGSGAALFDFDDDGRLDLYLLQNGGPDSGAVNRLFRQGADGRYIDVGKGSGLEIAGFNMGVAIGDVNNDGRLDVLVTRYGGLRLFLNQGNATFKDVTASRSWPVFSGELQRRSSTTIAMAGSTSWLSTI